MNLCCQCNRLHRLNPKIDSTNNTGLDKDAETSSSHHVIISFHVMEQVMVKWYNIYNAPGGPSAHAEWSLFVTCLMTLMGYNTERLAWTRNVSEPSMGFRVEIRGAAVISSWLFCSTTRSWWNSTLLQSEPVPLRLSPSFLSFSLRCLSLRWLQPRRLVHLTEALMRCVRRPGAFLWRRRRSKSCTILHIDGGKWWKWKRFITAVSGRCDEGFSSGRNLGENSVYGPLQCALMDELFPTPVMKKKPLLIQFKGNLHNYSYNTVEKEWRLYWLRS